MTTMRSGPRVVCALASDSQADLQRVCELVEAGHLKTIVDRQFRLEDAAEAHRYMDAGQRTGAVVIVI